MSTVELVISPRRRRIGTDEVDRLLPYRERRMVGPFIYTDLIGPDTLAPGVGVDVPVHPHIGLATITNLTAGSLVHRDSTGATQRIEPGGVNWMVAGAAVSHSERTPDDDRANEAVIAGVQTWVALPSEAEQDDPSFTHVPATDVPSWHDGTGGDVAVRLVAGEFDGERSPAPTHSPLFYLDVTMPGGSRWTLPDGIGERGLLVLDGEPAIGTDRLAARHLTVLGDAGDAEIEARAPARLLAIGGEPLGRRYIDWNFVASDRDLIDDAKQRWREFDWPLVDGDDELVPLPAIGARGQ